MSVSDLIAATISPMRAGLRMSTAPQLVPVTFGTEQPQFRSMMAGFREVMRRTAAATTLADPPKIWNPVNVSFGAFSSSRRVVPLLRMSASAEVISVKHSAAPWVTQTDRKAASE